MQKVQLTPIFHMIELYIQQYSELFVNCNNRRQENLIASFKNQPESILSENLFSSMNQKCIENGIYHKNLNYYKLRKYIKTFFLKSLQTS